MLVELLDPKILLKWEQPVDVVSTFYSTSSFVRRDVSFYGCNFRGFSGSPSQSTVIQPLFLEGYLTEVGEAGISAFKNVLFLYVQSFALECIQLILKSRSIEIGHYLCMYSLFLLRIFDP